MRKEFVKCKVERSTSRREKPSAIIEGLGNKELLDYNFELKDLFLIFHWGDLRFKICQITNEDSEESGYNILYDLQLKSESKESINEAIIDIENDGYIELHKYIKLISARYLLIYDMPALIRKNL